MRVDMMVTPTKYEYHKNEDGTEFSGYVDLPPVDLDSIAKSVTPEQFAEFLSRAANGGRLQGTRAGYKIATGIEGDHRALQDYIMQMVLGIVFKYGEVQENKWFDGRNEYVAKVAARLRQVLIDEFNWFVPKNEQQENW